MKKREFRKLDLLLYVFIFLMVLHFQLENTHKVSAATTIMGPSADAMKDPSGFYPDGIDLANSYENSLFVGADKDYGASVTYLKFDVSTIEGTVNSASLNFTPTFFGMTNSCSSINYKVYSSTSNWNEFDPNPTIIYSPIADNLDVKVDPNNPNQVVNVTTEVSNIVSNNGNSITLVLEGENLSSYDYCQFAFRDKSHTSGSSASLSITYSSSDKDGIVTTGSFDESLPREIPSTATNVNDAAEIFDFTITDGGTGDGNHLTVTSLDINVSGTDANKLTYLLNGPDLNNVPGTYSEGKVTWNNIAVGDGSSETYVVKAFYNNNSGITDNHAITLSIDGDTDVTVDPNGTLMASGQPAVTNNGNAAMSVTATKIAFTTQPLGSTSGIALTGQPVVSAVDAFGNVDKDYTDTITLTETSTGSLSGDVDVAAVNGVATFTDLVYTATADQESFTLTASSGLGTLDSNSIVSDVAATKLIFTNQPSPINIMTGQNHVFTNGPVVKAVNAQGLLDTDFTETVTISENGTGNATFTNASVQAQNGVVAFTGLTINYNAAETFQLTANDQDGVGSDLAMATSIDIVAVSNIAPTISISNKANNQTVNATGIITLTGTAADADNDPLTVKATIDGVQKTANVSGGNWTLSWNGSDLTDGSYQNIVVTVEDGKGGTNTDTYTGTLNIDKTAPTVNTLSPANGQTDVGKNDSLVITFNENTVTGAGNIAIKKKSDNSDVELIDVTSGKVTGSGTTTITINPDATFTDITDYYVEIPGTVFKDEVDNFYAGVSDTITWAFKTGDFTPPTYSDATSNLGGTSVDYKMTSNEAGTAYYVVLPENAGNPSAAQIKAGEDSTGAAVTFTGNGAVLASTEKSFSITGLTSETSYTIYSMIEDSKGNQSNVSSKSITTLDITSPTVTTVTMESDNTNAAKAKVGDTVTLDIETNEDIQQPTVTMLGNSATVTNAGDTDAKTWQATYTLQATDMEGDISFTLDFKDVAGNSATQVTAITSGTLVNFDKTAPTATTVTIKSDNADATKAKIGDTITLDITIDEDVKQPTVTIAGNAATVSDAGDNDVSTWQATYTMVDGDTDGNVAFTVSLEDLAGNKSSVNASTDGKIVMFDGIKPTAQVVTMSSSNATPTLAKVGDTITLDIETSENVQQPTVTIVGNGAGVTNAGDSDETTWQASYTLHSGVTDGPVSFTLNFNDLVGNIATQVTGLTSGSVVRFDKSAPTVTTVTMSSNNGNDPSLAKVGDVITLEIVTIEAVQTPIVTIAGNNAAISDKADNDATTWNASYTMQSSDTDGPIAFTLDFDDLVGNSGTQVTAVTTGNAITFDKTAPTASTVKILSNNAESTAKAKVGDEITLNLVSSEIIQSPTVSIAGHAVTAVDGGDGKTWTATYTMAEGDNEGAIPFTVDFQDKAGNSATQVTNTTDDSSVEFDKTAPTGTIMYNPAIATNTDVEATLKVDADVTVINNNNSKAYTFTENDSFTFEFKDGAGNVGLATATVNYIDKTPPTAPTVTMSSSNTNDPSLAKVGDVITLEIVTNEAVQTPIVIIAGNNATVSNKADNDAATWSASYPMQSSDTNGEIAFTLDFDDLVGNGGTQVTAVTTGNAITFDKTAPTTSTVTIASNNADPTKAKIGEVITLEIVTDEAVVNPVVTIIGNQANVTNAADNDPKTWLAAYTLQNEDQKGPVPITIDLQDIVGNHSAQVTATTDNSAVRALSNNADLSGLTLSAGTIVPDFTSETVTYTVNVGSSTGAVNITPEVSNSNATVQVNENEVTSGQASKDISLAYGRNELTIIVTAEDDSTKEYKLTVNRERRSSNRPINQPITEEITVDVESGNDGTSVSETTIRRTTDIDGKVKDDITLTEESAKETIENLREQNGNTARIVIPDSEDEVDEVNVSIPEDALNELKDGNTNVEIETESAKLTIPNSTLAMFDEDLYFRVVPIRDEDEKAKVKERAEQEEEVQRVANGRDIDIVGTPAEIETNMQNHPTKITMPLDNDALPSDEEDRQELLDNLVIYIEHSDGSKELVRGELTTHSDGSVDVEFFVDRFSTFTIVYMEGSEEYFSEQEKQGQVMHQSYITGYQDGTFRPDQKLTRAELATLLARNLSVTTNEEVKFSDLAPSHWAYGTITKAAQSDLINGYPNGEFRPDQVITRAEMATIVYKWKNLQADGINTFTDIDNHWAVEMISALATEGIMSGYADGTFKPNQALSRAEAVTVINKVLQRGPLKGVTNPTWLDVSSNHWAYGAIEEASRDHHFKIIGGNETLIKFNK